MRKIISNAIGCGDVIESRAAGEYVRCSCGACAVDGGLECLRRVGNPEDFEELSAFAEDR